MQKLGLASILKFQSNQIQSHHTQASTQNGLSLTRDVPHLLVDLPHSREDQHLEVCEQKGWDSVIQIFYCYLKISKRGYEVGRMWGAGVDLEGVGGRSQYDQNAEGLA